MRTKVKEFLAKDWTDSEKTLVLIVCLLAGIVIGFLWAPIKRGFSWTIGSYNKSLGDCDDEWLDEED